MSIDSSIFIAAILIGVCHFKRDKAVLTTIQKRRYTHMSIDSSTFLAAILIGACPLV